MRALQSVWQVWHTALQVGIRVCPNPNQIGITMPAFALYKNMITAVPGCVDTCAILPQPCRTHGVRVPASCVAHAPEAQRSLRRRAAPSGAGVPGLACRYVPRTCAPGPQVSGVPEDAPTPRWAVFLAGALAGCTATCLCYPLDVVPRHGQRWPGSQQPVRPPATPRVPPACSGRPPAPEREERPRRLGVPR